MVLACISRLCNNDAWDVSIIYKPLWMQFKHNISNFLRLVLISIPDFSFNLRRQLRLDGLLNLLGEFLYSFLFNFFDFDDSWLLLFNLRRRLIFLFKRFPFSIDELANTDKKEEQVYKNSQTNDENKGQSLLIPDLVFSLGISQTEQDVEVEGDHDLSEERHRVFKRILERPTDD